MHELAHGGRRALRDPIFLGALALLLLNDHVLKGSGALPGWATGKLSDLAGMIVAPVVVVALLGLRSARAKGLAFAAVAALFSLLEVSASAAASWDHALGAIGIPSRSVADPSDLVGLAMLPLAWWIVRDRREGSGSRALQRTSLAVAVFACVATSAPYEPGPPAWTTGAWIENRASTAITVRLRWPAAELSCVSLLDADLGAAIAPEVFDDGLAFELAPGDTIPLEPAHAEAAVTTRTTGSTGATGTRNPCDVVRISIDGLEDRIVAFEQPTVTRVPVSSSAGSIPAGGVVVLGTAGALSLEVPSAIYTSSIVVELPPAPPSSCIEARGAPIVHDDPSVLADVRWIVTERAVREDGCVVLALEADPGTFTRTLALCVPGDFVPFQVGETIEQVPGRDARIDSADGTSLVIVSGEESLASHGLALGLDAIDATCVERAACGAALAPATLRRAGAADAVELGAPFEITTDEGRLARVLLTRAEHVLVAPTSCEEDAALTSVATRIDAVMVITDLP